MATKIKTDANLVALSNQFTQAGYATAKNEQVIADLQGKLTTANEKALGLCYQIGYVAGRLFDSLTPDNLAKARLLMTPKATRTEADKKAMRAAAKRWERIRAKLDVKASDKRGGARPGAGKKAKGKAAPQVIKAAPQVKTAAEALAHVMNMAKMLSSFCTKNGDTVPSPVASAVADFTSALTKIKL